MELKPKIFFPRLFLIAAALSAISLIWGVHFMASFSLGCLLMIANFFVLAQLLEKILHSPIKKASAYTVLLSAKFFMMGGVIYAISKVADIDWLAFVFGFFLIAISATYAIGGTKNQDTQETLDEKIS